MTSPTLILLSSSKGAKTLAQEDSAVVLVEQNGKKLSALEGNVSVDLPAKTFLLRQNIQKGLQPWLDVLDWLKELGGGNAYFVIDFDHPLREMMLVARAMQRFTYSLYLSDAVERVFAPDYALLGNADAILWEDGVYNGSLHKSYVGPYTSVSISQWQSQMPIPASDENIAKLSPLAPIQNAPETKRVLLVSYFSGPCRTVGVQRINYWTEQIKEISGGDVEVHLATAIDWRSDDAHVHFIPDLYIASLLSASGDFPDWANSFHDNEVFDAKHFNTLSYYWRYAIETYFENLDLSVDAVVISGNPFAVFDFATFAKRQWYAKVFLDYRDPFANNSRMKYTETARDYAKFVERGYNFQADVCLSVNEMCFDYLEGGEEAAKLVIPNGYDERAFEGIEPGQLDTDTIKFVHAGSFYHDRSPRALVTQLDPTLHSFHHVGSTAGIDDDLLSLDGLVCHGRKPYEETLSLLGAGDCGIVYVSETGFETPTKLYEYLAFGIDVLICTHGPIKGGALQQVLQDYPGVFWCKNTDEGVRTFLEQYEPTRSGGLEKERFTRRYATQNLVEAIREQTTS